MDAKQAAVKRSWIDVLRGEVDRTSLSRVGLKIGRSSTTVHQVCKGSYKGRLDLIEERVRGAFMAQTVTCPALGEINRLMCQENQDRPFAATNPQRVAVYKACRNGCPHSKHGRPS